MIRTNQIRWHKGAELSAEAVDAMAGAGIDLDLFRRPVVEAIPGRNGVLHGRNCPQARTLGEPTRLSILDLVGCHFHGSCCGYQPVPDSADRWLTRALAVTAAAQLVAEAEAATDVPITTATSLSTDRDELAAALESLTSGHDDQDDGAGEPIRPYMEPDAAAALLERIDRICQSVSTTTVLYAAAAGLAGDGPPAGSKAASRAVPGSGAATTLVDLWKTWRDALEHGDGLTAAEMKIRAYHSHQVSRLGLDIDGLLAHWRADLDRRVEEGRTPVLIVIPRWLRETAAVVLTAYPCRETASGAAVAVVDEIIFEALQVRSVRSLTLLGPAGEQAGLVAEIIAGLWDENTADVTTLVSAARALAA